MLGCQDQHDWGTSRRDKRDVPLASSVGNRGHRSKRKRKANQDVMFDEAEVEKCFNQGKSNGNKINNKKVGRRISTRETGLKGLGKNKKAIADACKELYGSGNISMEHVKEVGELIGVLWVWVEEGSKMEKPVDVVSMDEGTAIGKNQ
ncbi:hypothetical protein Tco_1138548 [Tanacetum coccineum]